MNLFLPPSPARVLHNLRLLAGDWRRGGALMRYFIASQLVAGLLSLLCSAASLAALRMEADTAGLWLIAAAGACIAHSVHCWTVLRRRFQVRYALF